MDEKLGIDVIDQTIIDWNNITDSKMDKLNEELKEKGNYLLAKIIKNLEVNNREELANNMEQLANIDIATNNGIIAKSREKEKEIVDKYISDLKNFLNTEAKRYGRDLSIESKTTSNINECVNKYISQFQDVKKIYDEAIFQQMYIKSELQKGMFRGISLIINSSDEEKVAEIEFQNQKQNLEKEIKLLADTRNKEHVEEKLKEYRKFISVNKLQLTILKNNYLKYEMKNIYSLLEKCDQNIANLEEYKEQSLIELTTSKNQSLVKSEKRIKINFFINLINKLTGERKFNNLVLNPLLNQVEESYKKDIPTSIQKAISTKEKYNEKMKSDIEKAALETANLAIAHNDPITNKVIEDGINYEFSIKQLLDN